jgi:hypothetical protein
LSTNTDGTYWTTTADQFHSRDARQASSVTSWKPDVGSLSGLTLLRMRCVKPSCDASVLVSFLEYGHTHAELRKIEGAQENHDCMVLALIPAAGCSRRTPPRAPKEREEAKHEEHVHEEADKDDVVAGGVRQAKYSMKL